MSLAGSLSRLRRLQVQYLVELVGALLSANAASTARPRSRLPGVTVETVRTMKQAGMITALSNAAGLLDVHHPKVHTWLCHRRMGHAQLVVQASHLRRHLSLCAHPLPVECNCPGRLGRLSCAGPVHGCRLQTWQPRC